MPRYKVTGSYPVREYVTFSVEAESPQALHAMCAGKYSPELSALLHEAIAEDKVKTTYGEFDDNYGYNWDAWDDQDLPVIEDGYLLIAEQESEET